MHFWSLYFSLIFVLVPTFLFYKMRSILVPTIISLTKYHMWQTECTVGTLNAYMANKIILKNFIWHLRNATLAF